MFSAEGNDALREILEFNLPRLREVFHVFGLKSETARRTSFYNAKLRTERGASVDAFFGAP